MFSVFIKREHWPIRGSFVISRGAKTAADVVVVELGDGVHIGRGECVPYARYGESIASVIAQIESLRREIEGGLSRHDLQSKLPAGAARNALDCALWDLEAKQKNMRIWDLIGQKKPDSVVTAYTLSLDTPEKMRVAAQNQSYRPLLKLKLAGEGDLERVRAVRTGAPDSTLIVDANEGWNLELYSKFIPDFAELGVALIEQPFPAGQDDALLTLDRPIPICADESCHDRASLPQLLGRYDMINIKLDKTGGLTEALLLREAAQENNLTFMIGCMLATSLAMAPATLLTAAASFVDLDGPLLLQNDRSDGLQYEENRVSPPEAMLWG